MSVRKSASHSSREYNSGANALKSLGVWALLAGASFIIGLFILSPLINVAAGSRSVEPTVKPLPAQTNSAAPAQHEAAPAQRPPAERQADSDVQISPEKPGGGSSGGVQQPLGVDESSNTREDSSSRLNQDRTTEENASRGQTGSEPAGESASNRSHRNASNADTQIPEPSDRPNTTSRDRSAAGDEPKPRRHRNRSSEGSKPSGESATPPDVQKGEGIDR